jgi:hypothetical protein
MDRRTLLEGVAAGALVYAVPGAARAQSSGQAPVLREVERGALLRGVPARARDCRLRQ